MGGARRGAAQGAARPSTRGDYRWAATLLNHLVFADPDDAEARELLARAYDQLGYRRSPARGATIYLTGAYELRHGVAEAQALELASAIGPAARTCRSSLFFASMATRVERPEGRRRSR